MGPEMNTHHTTCFGNHLPCGLITYRKNAVMGLNVFPPDVVFEPIGEPLGDEDKFLLSTALGFPKG